MKRRLIFYSLSIAAAVAFAMACNKNSLEVDPVNPSEADYFSKTAEFDRAVLGIYARLTDLYNHNGGTHMQPVYFLPGDDVTRTGNDPFEHFSTLNATNNNSSLLYQKIYQLIGRANVVLQKLAIEKGVYTDPTLKNIHKGEALFLRGWSFFRLWIFYGKAPVVTERIIEIANLYPKESKGLELLDQAIKDLSEAASLLPAAWPASQRGRATANSANSMLGKVLVFRGTVNKNSADLAAAITAFNKINNVALVPNFADNFDASKENNAESLFEFQASTAGGDNIWLPNEFDGAIGTMSAYWGYFYEGNTRSNNNINYLATDKLLNAFDPADPRLPFTVNTASATGRQLIKWSKNDLTGGNGNSSANNPRILRYADVLLLKAEALLQSGGSVTEAIGLINQIRTRARNMVPGGTVPADYPTTETSKATILNWIMNERFIELAAEGERWPDLKRWHMAGYITLSNSFFNPANASAMSFEAPKNLVLPIPIQEIDRNPNITQNEGY